MDLCHLESRVNHRFDLDDVAIAAEMRNECSQIGETHFVHPRNIVQCVRNTYLLLTVRYGAPSALVSHHRQLVSDGLA